jgi:hypothetical protein
MSTRVSAQNERDTHDNAYTACIHIAHEFIEGQKYIVSYTV